MKIRTLLIALLIAAIAPTAHGLEIVNLGSYGSTCAVEPLELNQQAETTKVDLGPFQPSISFLAKLNKTQEKSKHTFNLNIDNNPLVSLSKKIYVFSALDETSVNLAKNIKADYGIAVEYNSINDIKNFRNESNVSFPIQLANDDIIDYLKIKSYPSLVTIEGSRVTVESIN